MKKMLLIAVIWILGCEPIPEPPTVKYHFKMIRPDGVIHKEWDEMRQREPLISACSGQAYLYMEGSKPNMHIPNGWQLDWEIKPENE